MKLLFIKKKIQSKLYIYVAVNTKSYDWLRLVTKKYLKQAVLIWLPSCIQIDETKSDLR